MICAYIVENQGTEDSRNNQPLFQLINQMNIPEENLVFDNFERTQLPSLIDRLGVEDTLFIRSAEDMADNLGGLINTLKALTDKKITLFSCNEPFLCGEDYLDNINGFVCLYLYFYKKNKEEGYAKALSEGRVGRPPKTKEIEQAIAMYQSGNFKISQIEMVTGISKSTIYRYVKGE